ncbi:P-loop containing nucleoside triphosphate hydrolase protein [Schizothecium vesticola]|uniref:P-loop containing nucleoside triphosphate hydrolase protein n=1 Tax=Schizothecium vesticola TaxID=314040 RepID=A0AA40K948_9PEZI|nr:P-loop containing nucleoside triphosphate hydrolase protein [Schizothecium vesticola]
MLRGTKSPAILLQKTYDESYLTCSTAVYYESQGNEPEAMRCWRQALDQISDRYASGRIASDFAPSTETEKALVDSLRRLELQCKERIDLLEALRLSRQQPRHDGAPSPSLGRVPSSGLAELQGGSIHAKGWIGDGTIPAVAYRELSRPKLPKRPSTTTTFQEPTFDGGSGAHTSDAEAATSSNPPSPFSRHTMRTTLRPGRLGDRSAQSASRRASLKPIDGPGASKAASLAWSVLGQRDKAGQESTSSLPMSPSNPGPLERSRKSLDMSSRGQWDSHSRRLVTTRSRSPVKSVSERTSPTSGSPYRQPEYFSANPGPSSLSVTAAANALNASTPRESRKLPLPEAETAERPRQSSFQTPQGNSSGLARDGSGYLGEQAARISSRKVSSDPTIKRRPLGINNSSRATPTRYTRRADENQLSKARRSPDEFPSSSSSSEENATKTNGTQPRRRQRATSRAELVAEVEEALGLDSSSEDEEGKAAKSWKKRKADILKKLPGGVDENAAKQILNEIVVHGDQVRWGDVAGLDVAKAALREAVVYPFLRPDLFMGLREPARGVLLFGPPGTGKTMLARAVATESKSTFFSISASSLTSKYLGESEKLVRALFVLAKLLAPSIIFVDEIDSLLSQRSGSGEHEATRRIKTEFLIQWSDLQRAAAGREVSDKDRERGDANRVLVLAATNLPWVIDEAARRRFVRRQYIPLPESETRKVQIQTLLAQQKHTLGEVDIDTLVSLTEGFSGSDITALAKDAAMGPLRSLGEAVLQMTMEEIRPIELKDFVASLVTIRPSVSKSSLRQYEDWAKEFGERGG